MYWLFWYKALMFAYMKNLIVFIVCLISVEPTFAQDQTTLHGAMKVEELVSIPAAANNPNQKAFKVMREPVLAKDFKEFISYLYSENNVVQANSCVAAVASDLNIATNYIILSNPAPIAMYAEYLSKRMSTKTKKVSYQLITENQWKQAKGMPNTYDVPKKNPYGLIFQHGIFEWKTMNNGHAETFADTNGYMRSSFRLVYSEKTIQTAKKK